MLNIKNILTAKTAQQEKMKDKDIMKHDSKIHVVTFDLQSVLMLSRLTYKVYSCCHV